MISNDNIEAVLAELQRSYPEALELCVLRVELARAQARIAELSAEEPPDVLSAAV